MQLKSDSKSENSAVIAEGMHIVFLFLGISIGITILVTIFLVAYCIHRRRNFPKHMNNGMYILKLYIKKHKLFFSLKCFNFCPVYNLNSLYHVGKKFR